MQKTVFTGLLLLLLLSACSQAPMTAPELAEPGLEGTLRLESKQVRAGELFIGNFSVTNRSAESMEFKSGSSCIFTTQLVDGSTSYPNNVCYTIGVEWSLEPGETRSELVSYETAGRAPGRYILEAGLDNDYSGPATAKEFVEVLPAE